MQKRRPQSQNTVKATCHPERPHYAKTLCGWCYKKDLFARKPEFKAVVRGQINEWARLNKEKVREYRSRWKKNNRHKVAAEVRRRRGLNPERHRQSVSAYAKRNPHLKAAIQAKRRAAKRRAVPKWLTPEQNAAIKLLYRTCPKGWNVDHIVPIQGEAVCGLHVPWNLQHLPASENSRKHNNFTPTS